MHRLTFCFTVIAALGAVTGCTLDPAFDPEQPGVVEQAGTAGATAVAGRRWVVYAPPSGCADLDGFIAEPLFPPTAALPAQLADYCLYT